MQSGDIKLWKMKIGWFRSMVRFATVPLSIVSAMIVGLSPTLAGEAIAAEIEHGSGLLGRTAVADPNGSKPLRATSQAQIEVSRQNSATRGQHMVFVSAQAGQVNEALWISV